MRRFAAIALVCLFACEPAAFAGLGADKTEYVGGTENQIKEGTEGKSTAKDDKSFLFQYKGGALRPVPNRCTIPRAPDIALQLSVRD
jgi:hypothetical protein